MAALTRRHSEASVSDGGLTRGELRAESSILGGEVVEGDRIGSLLEKYTFRETVKTVIEEEHLPELPAFLEAIGLGEKLDVSDLGLGFLSMCCVWTRQSVFTIASKHIHLSM